MERKKKKWNVRDIDEQRERERTRREDENMRRKKGHSQVTIQSPFSEKKLLTFVPLVRHSLSISLLFFFLDTTQLDLRFCSFANPWLHLLLKYGWLAVYSLKMLMSVHE